MVGEVGEEVGGGGELGGGEGGDEGVGGEVGCEEGGEGLGELWGGMLVFCGGGGWNGERGMRWRG